MKRKYLILSLISIIFLLAMTAVCAENNATDTVQTVNDEPVSDNAIEVADEQSEITDDQDTEVDTYDEENNEENAIIKVSDYTAAYNSGKKLKVEVKDTNNTPIETLVKIFYQKSKDEDYEFTDENGICYFTVLEDIASQKATISLDNPVYSAKSVTINVQITKLTPKITAKKVLSDTKSYFTLKAVVKDSNNKYINEGTVKFTINGKKYNVKVKKGVATKKIKLKKAKTYTYKATFSSKHYKTKTVSSKAYVKKYKKYHYFNAGKYTGKVTHKQYMKLVRAKFNGKNADVYNVKTGKYYIYKKPVYKTVKVKKTKWIYKKVLSYESFYYDDGSIDSYSYDLTSYYNKGWKYYGSYDKSYVDGYESYVKLKKKVKYTATKKVKTGYKKAKSPIYMDIETSNGKGMNAKGDRVYVWSSQYWYDHEDFICVKKIKI